jgi:uncharacterized protein (DUF1015 family)
MAKIYAFRGILYNQKKVKDISKVVAPPYDVISKQAQDNYYKLNNYNIIRLILGKSYSDDDDSNNRYTRAQGFLEGWLESDILNRDEKSSIYLYEQAYNISGSACIRRGFIFLIRLEDFEDKIVLPHELTFSGPKEDRLHLIRATRANLSPIFAFYEGNNNTAGKIMTVYSSHQPIIEIKDEDKVKHKLWVINDPGDIEKITTYLGDKSIFIADGHHRYETALNFRNEMKRQNEHFSGEEKYNRIMAYLVDINQGFSVLPTHRLIRAPQDIDMRKLEKFFLVEIIKKDELLGQMKERRPQHVFGMYYKKRFSLLILKDTSILDKLMDTREPQVWKGLDVTILHKLLIEYVLKVEKGDIGYSTDRDKASELVDRGEYQAAFFLNPVRKEEFELVAKAHRLMPQKSTYFYPKPLSGLVINKFGEDI